MRHLLPLLLLAGCTGCPHQPAPQPPTLDDVAAGLSLASLAVGIGADAASEPAACVGLSVVRDALDAAARGVREQAYPALSVDVTQCGHDAQAVDVPPAVDAAIGLAARVGDRVLTRVSLGCRDEAIARAAVAYVEGAAPAILSELREPDGLVVVPGVTIGECDTDGVRD